MIVVYKRNGKASFGGRLFPWQKNAVAPCMPEKINIVKILNEGIAFCADMLYNENTKTERGEIL